jgi:tight adherence protein B
VRRAAAWIVALAALFALLLPAGAAADAGGSASILAIDASASVRGEAIEAAMSAARAFAGHRALGQQLGALAFNNRTETLLAPTADSEAIERALAAPPPLADGTRLYDAVSAAVSELSEAGVAVGSVVVFSDGADTGSAASEQAVVRQAAAAGVSIYVVGLESGSFDPSALRGLARGGRYATATDPAQLESIFNRFGARLAVAPPGPDRGFWGSAAAMLAAGLLGALLLAAAVFAWLRPRREPLARRLVRFGLPGAQPEAGQGAPAAPRDAGAPAGPLAALERPLKERERWRRFEQELDVAGIETPAIELAAALAAATLLAMIAIGALAPFPLLALLGLLVPLAARALLERRTGAVRQRFADGLADNLQVVASAIRAGHSMVGSLAVLVEEAAEPAREEFRRIVASERVGVPLEDSIRAAARRMRNRDLEQLALVAIIQRETGGNTAEVIDRAVETIRERAELRRLMSTLTAQGRLSRAIVTALPVVLLIAISALNPGYISPLFKTGGGQLMLIVAAVMVVAGSLVIKRIVEVEA